MKLQAISASQTRVKCIEKWYTKTVPLASILRSLAYLCDKNGTSRKLNHIDGTKNIVADKISCQNFDVLNHGQRISLDSDPVKSVISDPDVSIP